MRGLKTTIALAVVLGGLTAYIYFVDSKKPADNQPAKDKVFTVAAGDIEEIQIKVAGGDSTRLTKGDGTWSVIEPLKVLAEPSEPTSITSNLSTLDIQRVVEENPTNLADYGLEPPRIDIGFRVKGANDMRHLYIGQKSPTGTELYAKKDDGKGVFLISGFLENTLNRTTFDLRDKATLKFNRDKVQDIQIAQPPKALHLVRKGDMDWVIDTPFAARADYGTIEGLIGSLFSTEVQKFVDENPKDLGQYGLTAPILTFNITSDGVKNTMLVGKDAEPGFKYAKDASRPVVFTIGNAFVESLQKGPNDYRRKDLFEFRFGNAKRVQFQRGAETISVEKATDKDGKDVWKTASGKDVAGGEAETSIIKFSTMRADSFVDTQPPAIITSDMVVTVTYDGGRKPDVVTFSKVGAEVFAVRDGEPGSGKLDVTTYDPSVKALDGLK